MTGEISYAVLEKYSRFARLYEKKGNLCDLGILRELSEVMTARVTEPGLAPCLVSNMLNGFLLNEVRAGNMEVYGLARALQMKGIQVVDDLEKSEPHMFGRK